MHTASLRQDDLTSGIMNDADRSAQRPTGKVLVFLCLKISFRQGLIGRRQPGTRVLSDKRLENFLAHGVLSGHRQKEFHGDWACGPRH